MQVESPFIVDLDIRGSIRNFADYIFDRISVYDGDTVALRDAETLEETKFNEFNSITNLCTQRLKELGIQNNTRVALIASNCSACCFVHLASAQLGCRLVCVNGNLSVDEIWHQIDQAEVTHAILESQFTAKMEDVKRRAIMRNSGRVKIIRKMEEVLGETSLSRLTKRESKSIIPVQLPSSTADSESSFDTASMTSQSTFVVHSNKSSLTPLDPVDVDDSNGYFIFYTSGTTGPSKPIYISHQQIILNLMQLGLSVYGPPGVTDKFLLPLNIHHLFGFLSLYQALVNGAELTLVNKYSSKVFLRALSDYKITYAHVTPPMILFLATDLSLENVNLRQHLRTLIVGGASLYSKEAKKCKERLAIRDLRQIYLISEMGAICTFPHFCSENIESVGSPLPGYVIKIMHFDNKNLCAPRQVGHICIKKPGWTSTGFYNQKNKHNGDTHDGYIRTGDAGFFDEKGCIYVVDRIKDIIKFRGLVLCPTDVESNIRAHPGIEDCAVVCKQSHTAGEVPAAFIVKSSTNLVLSTAEVRQHISGKIPQFKELRGGVFFVTDIPRTMNGAVLRRQLRQTWDRERLASREAMAQEPAENGRRTSATIKTSSLPSTRRPTLASASSGSLRSSSPKPKPGPRSPLQKASPKLTPANRSKTMKT
ncbi:unnamed protein product [Bursaphelenchus xylophilus]|uniref:(pine wood nematode) hypothetical protein n=1 Tax=Bursaphelenchus xylophilus TaxID=6326 RepID=A0A1I7SPY5_BURXY|nr:unnamed protein product [Bursaphelenchus xylophilus]CAG9109362.1 unnamed protein product [Bursaphelenchus xylophilus]